MWESSSVCLQNERLFIETSYFKIFMYFWSYIERYWVNYSKLSVFLVKRLLERWFGHRDATAITELIHWCLQLNVHLRSKACLEEVSPWGCAQYHRRHVSAGPLSLYSASQLPWSEQLALQYPYHMTRLLWR